MSPTLFFEDIREWNAFNPVGAFAVYLAVKFVLVPALKGGLARPPGALAVLGRFPV